MANEKVMTITSENFEQEVANSKVPVLLDFWAPWCAPCRMIAPTIDAIAEEMDGKIKVGKVNVDEQPDLAQQYQVMSIPTLAMIKGQEVVYQAVGAKTKDALKSDLEKAL